MLPLLACMRAYRVIIIFFYTAHISVAHFCLCYTSQSKKTSVSGKWDNDLSPSLYFQGSSEQELQVRLMKSHPCIPTASLPAPGHTGLGKSPTHSVPSLLHVL